MSPTEWREVELGAVATVSWGDTTTTKAAYTDSGFVAYSASGPDGHLPYADHHSDGVVVSAIGAQCGKTWFASGDWSCIKNTMWLRSNDDSVLTRYLYFATGESNRWPRRGAAQPFIALTDAKRLRLSLPDLHSQKIICRILGSLDDLIESNTRRIEILEEMAQAIYREWFVEFRYPGHEDVPVVDSDLGPIPKEWAVRRLLDETTVIMGQSPKSEFYNDQGTGLPFHQGVTNFGLHFPTNRTFSTAGDRRAIDADILFSVRAPVGRINVSNGPLILGRGLCAIRPEPSDHSFVLYQLRNRFRELDTMGSGAIFNSVKRSDVEGIPLLWPVDAVRAAFVNHAGSMFDLIRALTFSNRNLRAARDLLLPRLISGEVDVSGLDLHVGGLGA